MSNLIHTEIINKETGSKLIIFEEEDFEYVDPIKHYRETNIVRHMILMGVPKEERDGKTKPSNKSKQIYIQGVQLWEEMFEEIKSLKIPDNLIKLLSSQRKNEQEKLLNGLVLTPTTLMCFLAMAYEKFGFTLSQYRSEFSQNSTDSIKMPHAYHVKEDGNIEVYGETYLSEGQLKQAIEHRKVKIAKFLDKGDEWHCFFTTYKSLRGEETWLGEKQPHYHYISNLFGIERSKVVEQIKSKKYNLGNLPHIKFEEYGEQPAE